MKLKYTLMIGLILVIISLGAVSAADADLSAGSEIVTDDVLSDDVDDDFSDLFDDEDDFEDDEDFEDYEDAYQIQVNDGAEYVYYLDDVRLQASHFQVTHRVMFQHTMTETFGQCLL